MSRAEELIISFVRTCITQCLLQALSLLIHFLLTSCSCSLCYARIFLYVKFVDGNTKTGCESITGFESSLKQYRTFQKFSIQLARGTGNRCSDSEISNAIPCVIGRNEFIN